MALERITAPIQYLSDEEYVAKKKRLLGSVNPLTESLSQSGEMIYCKRCYEPKLYDNPEKRFIVRCKCECEVRAMMRWKTPRRAEPVRSGDYNPFD